MSKPDSLTVLEEMIKENNRFFSLLENVIGETPPNIDYKIDAVGQLVNESSDEQKLELIAKSKVTIAYIKDPSEQMVRLHKMKWRL